MMKVFKTQAEVNAALNEHGNLALDDDVQFECSVKILGDINARNIKALDIKARNIDAWDIDAWNIDAENIDARNIEAENINAGDIDAWNIDAWNIDALNINAGNIKAWDINARNIDARNVKARNIDAWNIDAWNIDAWDIDAWNIDAWDTKALDIDARNITYYAFCIAYGNIKCKSATGSREKCLPPQCIDGQLIIKAAEAGKERVMAENKLTPPSGNNSWIEYAISTMETRDLYNMQFAADELPCGRVVTREEMRQAAKNEYENLQKKIQGTR